MVKLAITTSSSDSVNASIQPAAIEGRISGNVTGKERPQRIAAEVHRRLLQAAVERAEPRLHHHSDEAHGQRGVRDRHGPETALGIDRDEQQQQRQPGDDFRHHQRRIEHAGEQRAAPEAFAARQRHGGERAEQWSPASRTPPPTRKLIQAASSMARSLKNSMYQRSDQPPHTVTSREALKE